MHWSLVTPLLALLLGGVVDGGARAPRGRVDPPEPAGHFSFVSEPPIAEIRVGDPAPNFSYQAYDGEWRRLHHLLEKGPVLLVFGASEPLLAQMEQERNVLLDLGVIPVVIVDLKPAAARALVRRLGLKFTVLADHRGVIASQFAHQTPGSMAPGWFVIDQRGRVRGLQRGRLPTGDYPKMCARALALPMPGAIFPGARRSRGR